jgi:Icc-related predicted phosphoesterase
MKILSVSDTILDFIYSPTISTRFAGVDLVLGCGDLPYYYLEYIISKLDKPTFYVRGNHAHPMEYSDELGARSEPHGGVDLHRKVVNHRGLLLAGVQGSLRYRTGPYQYSQSEMFANILHFVPQLLLNRMLYGRFLDVFVTHAPPAGIHDESDLPHRGIKAFRWLIQVFQPAYHFHGHIHVYRKDTVTETRFGSTLVINSYGFRETQIVLNPRRGS